MLGIVQLKIIRPNITFQTNNQAEERAQLISFFSWKNKDMSFITRFHIENKARHSGIVTGRTEGDRGSVDRLLSDLQKDSVRCPLSSACTFTYWIHTQTHLCAQIIHHTHICTHVHMHTHLHTHTQHRQTSWSIAIGSLG